MAFRVELGDVTITCDTQEELRIALATVLELTTEGRGGVELTKRGQTPEPNGTGRWTVERFNRFVRLIRGKQKRVLKALIENPAGVTDENLRRELGFKTNNQLAGTMAGLIKNARNVDVGASDVYSKRRIQLGDSTAYEYHLAPSLIEVAKQVGWDG